MVFGMPCCWWDGVDQEGRGGLSLDVVWSVVLGCMACRSFVPHSSNSAAGDTSFKLARLTCCLLQRWLVPRIGGGWCLASVVPNSDGNFGLLALCARLYTRTEPSSAAPVKFVLVNWAVFEGVLFRVRTSTLSLSIDTYRSVLFFLCRSPRRSSKLEPGDEWR